MSITLTLPQARISLGWVVVQGQRIPVEIDMEWMLALARLVERTGGTSGDTNFSEYINQFFDAPPVDAGAREALRAVDELRNELATSRADVRALRGLIEELAAQIDAASPNLTWLFSKAGGAISGPISAVCSAAGGDSPAFNLVDNTGSYGVGMGPTGAEGYINYSAGTASTALFGHRWKVNGVEKMKLDGTGALLLTGTLAITGAATVAGALGVAGALSVTGAFGINGAAPPVKPAITGSRGANAALASLLTALASYGLLTDTTT